MEYGVALVVLQEIEERRNECEETKLVQLRQLSQIVERGVQPALAHHFLL